MEKTGLFMFKKILFTIFILIFCSISTAFAYDADTVIRVGISNTSFSKYIFDDEQFYSDGELVITDAATGETATAAVGENIRVTMNDGLFRIYCGGLLKKTDLTDL